MIIAPENPCLYVRSPDYVAMKYTGTLYGVKLSEPVKVKVKDIKGRHKVNNIMQRKADAALIQDMREDGQHDEIILTADHYIIDGGRRFEAAKKTGMLAVEARYLEPNVPNDILAKICMGTMMLRENPTEEQQIQFIIGHFGKTDLMTNMARGRYATGQASIEKRIAEIMHFSVGRAKQLASKARKLLRAEENAKSGLGRLVDLQPGEKKFAARRLAEYDSTIKQIEDMESKLKELKLKKTELRKEAISVLPARGLKVRTPDDKVEYLRKILAKG